MRSLLHTAASGLGLLLLIGCGPSATNQPNSSTGEANKLSGSGSSFIKPIMDKWVEQYTQTNKGVEINYQPQGSSAGVKQMIEKATDFGCSDAFMKKPDIEKAEKEGGAVLHIPLVLGAVVPAYNLDVDKPLNFTGEVLADIFMGKIKKWDDSAIADLNKGVKLPGLDISVAHRSDGSGTTSIFTNYLAKVSPEWKESRGAGNTIDWKGVGEGENQNTGMAGAIGKNKGSIGYIELTYALEQKDKIQFGAVKNKEGNYVLASPKAVSAAGDAYLAQKDFPEDLRYDLVDAPGAESYPISGTTWAVLYQNQPAATGKRLVDFLTWAVHDGQKEAEPMHYAPLPESLVKRIDEKLKTVKTDK